MKLHDSPQHWVEEILALWDLNGEQETDIIIHLVKPTPPCTRFQCVLAHLIVEQAPQHNMNVGIISIEATDQRGTSIEHEAHSLPDWMGRNMVLRKAELEIFCQTRICSVTLGALPFGLVDIEEIPRAVGLTIHIRPLILQADEYDHMELMQRPPSRWSKPTPPQAGQDLSSSPARCEGTAFVFNPNAPAFDPAIPFVGHMPENVQDLYHAWQQTAFSWEGESASTNIITWFVDQHNLALHHCHAPRVVRLYDNFQQWEAHLRQVWREFTLPGAPIMIHVVEPQPTTSVEAHVLIIQNPIDQFSTSLVTGFDNRGHHQEPVFQLAVTTPELLHYDQLLMALGMGGRCLFPGSPDLCALWYGNYEIRPGVPFPARDGHGLKIRITRRLTFQDTQQRAEAPVFLQLSSLLTRNRDSERLTTVSVAHEQWPLPGEREPDETDLIESTEVAVRLKWMLSPQPHPDFLILSSATRSAAEEELNLWGIKAFPVLCMERNILVCLQPRDKSSDLFDYVLVNADLDDEDDVFIHSTDHILEQYELMSLLYQLGFWRAVIESQETLDLSVNKVVFMDQKVITMGKPSPIPRQSNWPTAQHSLDSHEPFFKAFPDVQSPCLIDLGITTQDLVSLFDSHQHCLRSDFEGIELPTEIQTAIEACDQKIPDHMLDRLLIYADGSSLGSAKHLAPLRAEEEGTGDTWAYVILGERYEPPGLRFIGWAAHPVIYEEHHKAHLGANRVGADVAEREALSWAALWRLSKNWKIPTCFRSDSRTTLGQASGDVGAAQIEDTFIALRSSFQALEAALGRQGVQYAHVPGHSGEVWNELCDWLTKAERQKSFYCPRPSISMREWSKVIGSLWLVLNQQDDLPKFCGKGLHAPPPRLPVQQDRHAQEQIEQGKEQAEWDLFTLSISACTANVNSLSAPTEGCGGKIDFLRRQFIGLHFNFLGIQESKSPEFCSCVDKVLRLSSGCHKNQQGVELWINLAQPFGYINQQPLFLDRHDIQVVHKDPRVLLARIETGYWQSWLLVAYAPHSGLPLEQREQWWTALSELIHRRDAGEHMIAMIDANAAPGAGDDVAVFTDGMSTSVNTPLFRGFVEEHALFLPCTTAAHQGDIFTWTDPTGVHQHCIDYVLLSRHFLESCTLSRVVSEFDLGTQHWDHEPTAAHLEWKAWVPHRPRQTKDGLGFDPNLIDPAVAQQVLQSYTPKSWETDIEAQVHDFNQHVLTGLRRACPLPKNKPKKPYITEKEWLLRAEKLKTKKGLRAWTRRQKEERLGVVFRAWKNRESSQSLRDHYASYQNYLWCANLRLVANYRRAAWELRNSLKKAKQAHIKEKFGAMPADATAGHILKELRPILGPSNLKKLKVQTLPHIRNAQGEVCNRPSVMVEVWLEFFRQMEGGERMDGSQQRALWRANLESLQLHDFQINASELPSLIDLEGAYRRINPTKATGPDKIHPAFCRARPQLLARATFNQMMKLAIHGQEALDHKGGTLCPIWKSKGPKDECRAYRSILVSSFIGKSIHRSLRQRQSTLFEKYLQKEQLGGRPKVPVTLGVHLGRAFMRARRQQGHNIAMLYLDLTEAFYRILRQLVVGGPASDELIIHVGQRLGMSADLMQDLHNLLDEPTALEAAGLPHHMRNAIRAVHVDTFFKVRGQGDVCRTQLGSRPGDSFADVIFSYLWSSILQKLQKTMTDLGLVDSIPEETRLRLTDSQFTASSSPRSFLGPTWMDDTCVCVSDPSPTVLEGKIHQATGLLLELCDAHGLSPNLGAGKTEALLIFQGHGSRKLKIKYFGPSSDKTLLILGEQGPRRVRVVAHYTHLGCVIHHKGDSRAEARRRVAIAQQAFSQHRKHLLQNPVLPLQRRVELFRTLVLSRFCYGTESWTLATTSTKEYIHNALMRLFRRLLGRAHDDHLTDADILTQVGINSPTELLRLARLRYLGTLHKCAKLVPWGLLNSDSQWIALVQDDLGWAWRQLQGASKLPDPLQGLEVWHNIWEHYPSYWRRLIRRAGEHAILQRQRHHRVEGFHRAFLQLFREVRADSLVRREDQAASGPDDHPALERHACMTCKRLFRSKGGVGAHFFKRHGTVSRLRTLFDTTCCGHCLKEYHTFSKLHAHLRYSLACRAALWGSRRRYSPMGGAGSAADRALCQQHDGLLPPLQAAGPRLPDQQNMELPGFDLLLAEQIYMDILENEGREAIESVIRRTIEQHPVTWVVCRETLGYLREALTEQDIQALQIGDFDIQHLLQELQAEAAWPFLQEQRGLPTRGSSTHSLEEIEQMCLEEAEKGRQREPFWEVPRPMAKERFIVHAFSGRRRAGDFQHFIDQAQQKHSDVIIFTISVDLMVDPTWGDVSKESVRQFWLHAVRQRQVVGAMAGPPCETWSQARGQELPVDQAQQGRKGPRVLREMECLWGRAALALKEVRQLDVGNLLLLFTLELLITLAIEGGIGGLEHPGPPQDQQKASIWRLPLLTFLCEWPEFDFLEVSQGLFGAQSRKPTGLLLLHMSRMVPELRKWQLTTTMPKGASIGKTATGEWATGVLKEYPPAFCAGLANGFVATLRTHPPDVECEISPAFRTRAAQMVISHHGSCIGPDFAG